MSHWAHWSCGGLPSRHWGGGPRHLCPHRTSAQFLVRGSPCPEQTPLCLPICRHSDFEGQLGPLRGREFLRFKCGSSEDRVRHCERSSGSGRLYSWPALHQPCDLGQGNLKFCDLFILRRSEHFLKLKLLRRRNFF